MDTKRSNGTGAAALRSIPGKSLLGAAVLLLIGVVCIAIAGGILWAIGAACISLVLLMQMFASRRQARLATERFKRLRGGINTVNRQISAVSDTVTTVNSTVNTVSYRVTMMRRSVSALSPSERRPETKHSPEEHTCPSPSARQLFDIQRELDYVLWRLTNATATDAEADVLDGRGVAAR